MKVLALLGSPRKKGNSETLMHSVLQGVRKAGGKVETVRLFDLNIHPCIGCGGCDNTGRCVVEDDMQLLYDKVVAADRIILASPIYFYNITAQAKAFVDRTQALWSRKYRVREGGWWLDNPDRLGYFVSVCATRGEKVFDGAILTVKYAFDAMGVKYAGEFLVRGVDHRGEMAKLTDTLEEAEEFGRGIAEGIIMREIAKEEDSPSRTG